MPVAVAVAAGGALGALARYGLDRLVERRSFSVFPWSTFAINVSGCFVVGLVIGALVDRHHAPQWIRAALVVGFCGAYTTFSTFAQETLDLTAANDYSVALLNISASVIAGLVAVFLGNHLGRAL
jgi:fluoride exporter